MVDIREQLVADRSKTDGGGNTERYITIHETANKGKGAGAAAHANLQSRGNVRRASWHFSVDDTEVVQSFPTDVKCWHAGTTAGNHNAVAIEICVNPDSDYRKAVDNAAQLVAQLRHRGIGSKGIVQHHYWTGKHCPTELREGDQGISWDGFLSLAANYEVGVQPEPPRPQGPAGISVDGYWGIDTTKLAQRLFGTVADGEVWYQYAPNAQPALTTGWVWNWSKGKGSPLIAAMQRGLGISDDGVAGRQFFRALQARMGTAVDGELWAESPAVKEFQRRLNAGTW